MSVTAGARGTPVAVDEKADGGGSSVFFRCSAKWVVQYGCGMNGDPHPAVSHSTTASEERCANL